jgi:hypothetical protein
MPKQRDYHAEYAARKAQAAQRGTTVYRQREAPTGIAQREGFKTYSAYRTASEDVRGEFKRLQQQGLWDAPIPAPGSVIFDSMLKATRLLDRYSPEAKAKANRNKESLLARTKEGRALREALRKALGWQSGPGWGSIYFPAMRALY